MTGAAAVIHRLATAALRARGLEFSAPPITLGDITLLPHQVAAVHWLRARLARLGGALLADPPGLGKTFVALAVAAELRTKPLIIAPATLRTRWNAAARDTHITIDFVSTERLSSPKPPPITAPTLVIIDEAHHLRTPGTRRHQRTLAICASSQVLLLSATPIHNHATDLAHLAALFHHAHARPTTRHIRHLLTLRRTLDQISAATPAGAATAAIPRVEHHGPITTGAHDGELPRQIGSLPQLHSDSQDSHRLLTLGLIHALRSSSAALVARCEQRIAACLAIEHAVHEQVRPTHDVRRAFVSRSGDTQLAMPALLGERAADLDPELGPSAERQRLALSALRRRAESSLDDRRARVLRRLARWSAQPIVAFTQFTATATAIHDRLSAETGIALLHGAAARIATGTIAREEAIDRLLLPRYRARHDAVRLLITTDVLSEGLSLSGVATIVHLDLPWTAARLDQRIGRAARIGADVERVRSVLLPAPMAEDSSDALHAILARKRAAMHRFASTQATDVEVIRMLCTLRDTHRSDGASMAWSTVESPGIRRPTVIALVIVGQRRQLVASCQQGLRRPTSADWRALLAGRAARAPAVGHVARLRRTLRRWQADRELTETLSNPRTMRLATRRAADADLLRTSRASRAAEAQSVSHARRALRDGLRPADVGLVKARLPGRSEHQLCASVPASARRTPDVKVLAGVVIIPGH